MLLVKYTSNDARSKAAGGIERATSVVNTDHLRDEQSKSDADWRNESSLVLLLGQHEDSEHQFGSQDSLDEDTLHQTCTTSQGGSDVQLGREESKHHCRGGDTTSNLSKE